MGNCFVLIAEDNEESLVWSTRSLLVPAMSERNGREAKSLHFFSTCDSVPNLAMGMPS